MHAAHQSGGPQHGKSPLTKGIQNPNSISVHYDKAKIGCEIAEAEYTCSV